MNQFLNKLHRELRPSATSKHYYNDFIAIGMDLRNRKNKLILHHYEVCYKGTLLILSKNEIHTFLKLLDETLEERLILFTNSINDLNVYLKADLRFNTFCRNTATNFTYKAYFLKHIEFRSTKELLQKEYKTKELEKEMRKYTDYKNLPRTITGFTRRLMKEKLPVCGETYFTEDLAAKVDSIYKGGIMVCYDYWKNDLIENVDSYDVISEYPSMFLLYNYPTKFHKGNVDELKRYLRKGLACIITIQLHDFELECNTFPYMLEQMTRAKGKEITVTDLDFRRIVKYYKLKFDITSVYISEYAPLPKEVTDFVIEQFKVKNSIDKRKDPFQYQMAKIRLNSIYGIMCQNPFKYGKSIWEYNAEEHQWNWLWGVWTAALGRHHIYSLLESVSSASVCYIDTDCIKGQDLYGVEEFNDRVLKRLRYRGFDVICGILKKENKYPMKAVFKKMKTYATQDGDEFKVVMSGVVSETREKEVGNIENFLNDDFIIEKGYKQKILDTDYIFEYYAPVGDLSNIMDMISIKGGVRIC